MTRRNFQYLLSLGALVGINQSPTSVTAHQIKPPKLKAGDRIGLIAPGSPVPDDRIQKAIETVKKLGYQPILGKYVQQKFGYLAGTDQERLFDFHQMFEDDTIHAVWCIRGGYGCTRLLPSINYEIIKNNPKPFIGYSDITALHLAIHQEAGMVTFHGPVAGSLPTDYTMHQLKKVLSGAIAVDIEPYSDIESTYPSPYTIRPGVAEGTLIGGNLSLLAAMVGTKWSPSYKSKLVFIEDIGEKPYRIDRMFVQMAQGTDLHEANGIIMGVFNDCEAKKNENSLTLRETLENQFRSLQVPVYYGFSFGHIDDQCTLPIGISARFNTESGTLSLLESALQ